MTGDMVYSKVDLMQLDEKLAKVTRQSKLNTFTITIRTSLNSLAEVLGVTSSSALQKPVTYI